MSDGDLPVSAQTSHRIRAAAPVVVGADGSGESARGLLFAADLAVVLGSELVVVHALGMYDRNAGWRTPVEDHEAEAAAMMRDTWCAPLGDIDGLDWRGEVVQGAPVDALLRVSDEVDAGFIVLGSHGAGRSDQPLLGSTSHWVVRNSHRPVVIVPPDDNHPHRRTGSGAGAMNAAIADS